MTKSPAHKSGRAHLPVRSDNRPVDKIAGKEQSPDITGLPAKSAPIVPRESVAGNALTLVIAIMTFLVCVTFGAVTLVSDTASAWKNDIAREVTIQVRPVDGTEIENALAAAREIASRAPGVAEVYIIDQEATVRLLEPWLGSGLDVDELPIPRLLSVRMAADQKSDFSRLKSELKEKVPGASLDDHQAWLQRLTAMAGTTVTVGLVIMALVISATVLTVVFATRGAMSSNQHIIEVLHFVGAEESYIARQFQQHFLLLGLKGGFFGGVVAAIVFFAAGIWTSSNIATPESDQVTALFGRFSVGAMGYAGTVAIVVLIALFTALTSRATVLRHLDSLDQNLR